MKVYLHIEKLGGTDAKRFYVSGLCLQQGINLIPEEKMEDKRIKHYISMGVIEIVKDTHENIEEDEDLECN